MIIQLRNKFKAHGFKVVLWITLLSMIIVFAPSVFKQAAGPATVIATINGREIGMKDYERRVYQETERIAYFRQQLGEYADTLLKSFGLDNPRKVAYESLVNDALLQEVSDGLGLALAAEDSMRKLSDPNFVVTDLADLIPMQVLDQSGRINISLLRQHLQRYGLTMADFEQQVEEKLKRKLVKELIGSTIYVTDDEVAHQYRLSELERNYSVITLPFDTYLKKAKADGVTDAQLQRFFQKENAGSKRYWQPEHRTGTVWTFYPHDYGIKVNDEEIDRYYQTNKAKKFVAEPAQIQVRRILFKLPKDAEQSLIDEITQKAQEVKKLLEQDATQFAVLAEKHSDDTITAKKGGLTDFFKRGQKDSAFERAAFRLQTDGDISDIVTTSSGLEILQREAKKAVSYKPLSAVKDQIEDTLLRQRFKTMFNKEMGSFVRRAQSEPDSFEAIAQQKGGVRRDVNVVKKDATAEITKLFNLRQGEWGMTIDGDKGMVVRLDTVQKRYEPELDAVKEQVTTDYYHAQAVRLIDQMAQEIQDESASNDMERSAKKHQLSYERLDGIKKDDHKKLSEVRKKGLDTQQLLDIQEEKATAVLYDGDNRAVVRLEKLGEIAPEAFQEKKGEVLQTLIKEKKDLVERAFIASLYRNATIKTTDLLMNSQDETRS